ncbi:MAG: hypothetical protein DRI86_14555 [Bacteroidetes bacterium]|nr:MAG: hypothetical protein DRI86_14555 [Bacteroidota bacterium]
MRKILLFLAIIWSFNQVIAQPWLENLPKNKTEYNFYDYQNTFNSYWQPYNLDKSGHYVDSEGITKKAIGWKQFKRWEYEMESQINKETGELPTQTAMQVYNSLKQAGGIQTLTTTNSWTSLGPFSPVNGSNSRGVGRVNCIAFHPTDNNTYWVGAPAGGLWKTTDNGSSWTCLTDSNDVLGVSSIIIPSDYATSNTIYIGTGDRDAWDNRSIGVLKSTDGGTTWNTTGISYSLSASKMVNKMIIDPNNNNTIIAATSNGVYKTTDGGSTWSNQLTSTNFIDLENKPGSLSTLYGSTPYGKIYISTNGGTTWTQKLNVSGGYRIEMAVTPNNSSIVYAIIANSNNGLKAIYKSTNSGSSFTSVYNTNNLLGWYSDASDSGGQGWYDLSMAASPSNSNNVIIGGVNSHRSTNGGSAWSCSNCWTSSSYYNSGNHPVAHADKHNLVYRSNGDLFECNDGGLFISTDDGATWANKSDGLTISQMYKLGTSKTVATETITGLQDNGTKLLSNGTWDDVKGGDGMECLIDYTDVNTQYGTYTNGQISRTTNHWTSATNIEPSAAGSGAWVTPYIIDPTTHTTLYAGYSNVYKSTNKGTSWTQISTMNSTTEKIRSMAISPSNTSVLYVADLSDIWKTTNGGTSWTTITGTLPVSSSDITYIAIKSTDPNTVWITLSGYNSNNVYKTTNGGTSWTNISTGLPSIPMYSIVQDTTESTSEVLYVGTELGVFIKDGTNSWQEYNPSLPKVRIGELEIYYDTQVQNNKLRAATYGRGLWEIDLYASGSSVPLTDFESDKTAICSEDTIIFTDITSFNPTSWNWVITPSNVTFINGTSTSSQNPEVKFPNSGYYNVSLTATNGNGSNTITKNNFIKVGGFQAPFIEDFETTSTTLSNWKVGNPDNLTTWSLVNTSGNGNSIRSATMNFYSNNHAGERDNLITPTLNLSSLVTATLQYKHAYTRYSASSTDSLIIYISGNCGVTWTKLASYGEDGTGNFATAPDGSFTQSGNFIPASTDDWCGSAIGADCDSIDISAYAGSANVVIAFQGYDNYGNNLYIDDINIFGSTTTALTAAFTVASSTICTGIQTTFTNTSLNATSYTWKENGTVISTSQNLSKTFTTGGNYTIMLIASDGSSSDSTSQIITVNPSPTQAAIPTGASSNCTNNSPTSNYITAGSTYALSYIWSLTPSNAGTINGNTTNAVVTWASAYTGTAYVQAMGTNACGNGIISDSIVVNVSSIPSTASTPTGADELCQNPVNTTYNISPITNASTYQWTISPSSAGVITNNGVNATVDWNNTFTGNATITVMGSNSCGNGSASSPLNISINEIPSSTATPTGPSSLCKNNNNTNYNVSPTNYATSYNWVLTPSNAGVITGNGTSAVINWDNQYVGQTNIKASATNNCGTGPYSNNLGVMINNTPTIPTITRSLDTLFSSSNADNQWYLSNNAINGATNYYYITNSNGNYYVKVTNSSGCSSNSANYYYNSVGLEKSSNKSSIKIFPNPTTDIITVSGKNINSIEVLNVQGQKINEYKNKTNLKNIVIDLSNNSYGVYLLKIKTKDGILLEKVVLE